MNDRSRLAYGFLLPATVLLFMTVVVPLFQAIYFSFTNYDFIRPPVWVGWQNYQNLWFDRLFWKVLGNTLVYLGVAVPVLVVLSLGLAILVNQQLRGITWFRALYYFPVIVSVVVASITWKWIYAEHGLLNYFLSWFGIGQVSWLTNPRIALFSIVAVTVWRGLGYYMVIFLAGLQTIPTELYEAAALDGSEGWQKHWDITIPLMRPYLILVTVISTIGAMKVFEEVYIMSRGGPVNSTKTLVYYLYEKGFNSLEMGYASAMGVVLFLLILGLSLGTFRLVRSTGV